MAERDYDIKVVFGTMKEVTKKHQIKFDPQDPVPSDDGLADRVFDAAVDFLEQAGGYCPDTKRKIEFSRDEILAARTGHPECRVGHGDDAKVWEARQPEASDRPWCHVGSGIVNTSLELAERIIESYASIPRTDSVAIPAFNTYQGVEFTPSHPLEIMGVLQNTRFAREVMKRAGRPGLAMMNGVPTSGSAQATLATGHPNSGIKSWNGWFIPVYAEMKIPFESLTKAAYFREIGANLGTPSSPMIGGYVGGPEGMAVASAAYILLSAMCFGTTYHTNFPVTLMESISSTRAGLWALSVGNQAMARHIDMPVFNIGYMSNGPATENYFYEAAAYIIASIASGVVPQTPFAAKGTLADGMTPLDAEFHTGLTDACVKLSRQQASEIVSKLLDRYEASLPNPEKGRTYPQCFDVKANNPDDELAKLYGRVRGEMAKLGLDW
jgi:hypothetical protein